LFVMVLQNRKICQVITQKGVIAAVRVLAFSRIWFLCRKNAMNAGF